MTLWKRAVVATMACLSWTVVQAQEIYDVGNGVTAPRAIRTTVPEQPLETDVVVRCVVTADGEVRDAAVVRPGNAADDRAAVKAVTQWQFAPGTKDGDPVAVRFYVQFHPKGRR